MKLFQRNNVSLEVRHAVAHHEDETHGTYDLLEVACITRVDKKPYVTSVVLGGGRHDSMDRATRNKRDRDQATREIKREAKESSTDTESDVETTSD